jgi:hypothetical protein
LKPITPSTSDADMMDAQTPHGAIRSYERSALLHVRRLLRKATGGGMKSTAARRTSFCPGHVTGSRDRTRAGRRRGWNPRWPRCILLNMADSEEQPIMEPFQDKVGTGWHVVIRYHQGHERRIDGFGSKDDAVDWITANSGQLDEQP